MYVKRLYFKAAKKAITPCILYLLAVKVRRIDFEIMCVNPCLPLAESMAKTKFEIRFCNLCNIISSLKIVPCPIKS